MLPHPEAGTWLERTLLLLAALERPLTIFSYQPTHHQVALRLAQRRGWGDRLERLVEPEPREGPLLALARMMEPRVEPLSCSGFAEAVVRRFS